MALNIGTVAIPFGYGAVPPPRRSTGCGCGGITFGQGLYRRESNIANRLQ